MSYVTDHTPDEGLATTALAVSAMSVLAIVWPGAGILLGVAGIVMGVLTWNSGRVSKAVASICMGVVGLTTGLILLDIELADGSYSTAWGFGRFSILFFSTLCLIELLTPKLAEWRRRKRIFPPPEPPETYRWYNSLKLFYLGMLLLFGFNIWWWGITEREGELAIYFGSFLIWGCLIRTLDFKRRMTLPPRPPKIATL